MTLISEARLQCMLSMRNTGLQKMLVTIRHDPTLVFGGNTQPAALAQLYYAAGGQLGNAFCACLQKFLIMPSALQALAMTYT